MEEKPSKADYFNKVESLLKDKNRVALFTHFCPDPDAIGSMMGMEFLCNKLGKGTSLFYTGPISHPQNRAFVNLLDPDLKDISEYKDSDRDFTSVELRYIAELKPQFESGSMTAEEVRDHIVRMPSKSVSMIKKAFFAITGTRM